MQRQAKAQNASGLQLPAQSAANITWALAALHTDSPLFATVVAAAAHRLDELKPLEAAAVAWAVAVPAAPGTSQVVVSVAERAARDLAGDTLQEPGGESAMRLLAASAWALACVLLGGTRLWATLSSSVATCAPTCRTQELANLAWALATASCDDHSAFAALAGAATRLFSKDMPSIRHDEMQALAWAFAAARHVDLPWQMALHSMVEMHGAALSLRGVAAVAWSWATLEMEEGELLTGTLVPRAGSLLRQLIQEWPGAQSSKEPLVDPLLQLAWALSWSDVVDAGISADLAAVLKLVGRARDAAAVEAKAVSMGSTRASAHVGEMPVLIGEACDVAMVLKPPNWEVDGSLDAGAEGGSSDRPAPHKLSTFLGQHFPGRAILDDSGAGRGFLGRLDAPSSGLVLCALSHEAYLAARLLQELHLIEREYVALCHGHLAPGVRRIAAPLRAARGSSSVVRDDGAPAVTCAVPCAWFFREDGQRSLYTLVVVTIVTGRKHQIRCHLSHIGHPVVHDQRYAPERFAEDRAWCPGHFLHRYRVALPAFIGEGPSSSSTRSGYLLEAMVPLPAKLREGLRKLVPASSADADAAAHWLATDLALDRQWSPTRR